MDSVEIPRSSRQRKILHVIGFIIGFLVSAFLVFQIFFLSRVLPHGGI